LSRILLDHNLALDLRDLLPGHDVSHAVEMGWHQIGNGELLTIAEAAGFQIVITADQNIRYQQNLSGRRLSLVVVSTNHWPTLRGSIGLIMETLGLVTSGSYHEVAVEQPPRLRRPPPGRPES
jgi:predicted nuclease of predicted toxin-antitoxin system